MLMKRIRWDLGKNKKLKEERGISFDEVVICIENGYVLDVRTHHSTKYKHQKIFVVGINGYVYYVPFVEDQEGVFLKTIIPSRKMVREYYKELEK